MHLLQAREVQKLVNFGDFLNFCSIFPDFGNKSTFLEVGFLSVEQEGRSENFSLIYWCSLFIIISELIQPL